MFKNYFTIAWRNLFRNRVSSFVNIGGLAVGIAVAMLTGLWLHDELSFNKYHKNYDRIAEVAMTGVTAYGPFTSPSLSYPMANLLRTDYKDQFLRLVRSTDGAGAILSGGDKNFGVSGQYMDEDAPALFSLNMIRGSRTGLADMHSIILAASTARALFGDADPMGKAIQMDNKLSVTVTGVYEDLPLNTNLSYVHFIAPFTLYLSVNDWIEKKAKNDWTNHFLKLYAEIKPGANFAAIDGRIANSEFEHIRNIDDPNYRDMTAMHQKPILYPMSKWHLEAADRWHEAGSLSPMRMVWIVCLIGAFVLLLACINFMNLSTAKSEKRAREVGIRKAIGSLRMQLVWQFFGESLVLVLVSFLFALGLTMVSLGWFNGVAGKQMVIPWGNPWFWAVSVIFIFITGIVAGSYPALYLSSFKPVKVLKGTAKFIGAGRASVIPRKVLVVFQFTISVVLINCTIIVLRQVNHSKDRPVGYTREGLVMMPMTTDDFQGKYDLFKTELLGTGVVENFAESMGKPTQMASNNDGFDWAGRDVKKVQNYGTLAVSTDFGQTIGWQFVQGRDFSRAFASDSLGMVINEAAVKEMGLTDPIGKDISWTWWMDRTRVLHYKIIGVIRDMIMESPYNQTRPTVFYLKGHNGGVSWMDIRVRPGVAMRQALPKIEAVMKKLVPKAPFNYQFADEDYAAKFAAEERISRLAGFFAVLAIFISSLGLFGLASFTAEQRTKEVGIRKVLGASVLSLWGLLNKEFVGLLAISLLIAIPIAYYTMSRWLESYHYRTEPSLWIFGLSGLGALAITLVTVSFQAVKAAIANPVNSLRIE
jgi:putative ABC transport system permease protein